ncbi:MAG: hypothetical protein NDI60_10425 [Elusimicrobiales bacterium]|nr:hypothetical protein [Elusimicrobiales bacterium]
MKKGLIAAVVAVAAFCGSARASDKALDALVNGVSREALNSSLAVTQPAARPDKAPVKDISAGLGRSAVYTNDLGCTVTVDRRQNGSTVYVQDRGRQATLGVLGDLSGGDIFSFCSPAQAGMVGNSITLSCGEQDNGGYHTRGQAVLGMNYGLSSVFVRGEVKKGMRWKTDTEISCEGLRPVRSKNAGAGVFMGEEACAVVDGIYPSDMTKAEALDMLDGCFKDVSETYKVPVWAEASEEGLVVLVGPAAGNPLGGNAAAAAALREELGKRRNRLFDFEVSLAVAK